MLTVEPRIVAYLALLMLYDYSPIPEVLTGTLDYCLRAVTTTLLGLLNLIERPYH